MSLSQTRILTEGAVTTAAGSSLQYFNDPLRRRLGPCKSGPLCRYKFVDGEDLLSGSPSQLGGAAFTTEKPLMDNYYDR